jgi:hypothetical protein
MSSLFNYNTTVIYHIICEQHPILTPKFSEFQADNVCNFLFIGSTFQTEKKPLILYFGNIQNDRCRLMIPRVSLKWLHTHTHTHIHTQRTSYIVRLLLTLSSPPPPPLKTV